VTGSGVGFRLSPTVPGVAGGFRDAEGFAVGTGLAGVWAAVWGRAEETWVGNAIGGGGGGMTERLVLVLGSRGVTFGREREGVAVERKRPSSSSIGIGGVVDLPLMTDGFEI
jgi:hypothetical protein